MTWEEFVANDTLGPDGSNLNRPDSPIWTGVNEETGGVEEYRESEQRYQSVLYDESDAKDNKLVGSKEPNQTFRFREKPTTKQVLDAVAATVDNDFLIQNHLAASRDLAELDTLAQLNEMKLRKSAKTARKANKNVKTSIVVQGNSEEYSIEKVLQFIGSGDEGRQDKKAKKKKSKKKIRKSKNEEETLSSEAVETKEQVQAVDILEEEVVALEVEKGVENNAEDTVNCTICFEARNQTYIFYPCGHATFCKDCALKLSQHATKTCPDCRTNIKDTFRVPISIKI